SCAACSARVEKAVSGVPGVTSCSVSLLTNSMGVEGNAEPSAIIAAVENAGYGASIKGNKENTSPADDPLKDRETPVLKKRLLSSLIFLAVLMYFSMGHMMLGFPIPSVLDGNLIAMGLIQLLLAAAVMIINQKFFINGFKGLIHNAPNMDTLVALGSSASFVWSVYTLFVMTDAQLKNNTELVMQCMNEFYFESAAMILTLITVGKLLEARSKGKTTDAIKSLINLAPKTANVIIDGTETTIPAEEVKKGDIFVVRPGESIPVDGIIIEGETSVNESALTGESIPVDKSKGDSISAATINTLGFIKCEASRVGEDTTLSQIIKTVSDAAATKAPIAKTADKVSGIFVPTVIITAIITTVIWLLVGKEFSFALARGISVLVISCPCALGLATPGAVMVGNGVGAKNGILFKTAAALEQTGKTEIVALDKTGTVTSGEPSVTDIIPFDTDETSLLSFAYALEKNSEHPLAAAVIKKAEEKNLSADEVTEFKALSGSGVTALSSDGDKLFGGSLKFISSQIKLSEETIKKADTLSENGKTPLLFTKNDKFLGIIAVADTIKQDSKQAVEELRNMGIRVVMLTGDNEKTAKAIASQTGINEVIAGILPNGKKDVITKLQKQGRVAMAGDGINDAPALTSADTGIAIGAGSDIAIDAADIVLMKNSLRDVPAAIRLSRASLKNIKENLFWAFFYNVIGIPLAAGLWIPVFGWQLSPMFGAFAMSLSSFCVVSNALRLNFFKLYDASRDKKIKISKKENKEETTMKKTMKIEGMMCSHCEARVKKVLEALPEVESAEVSHTEGTAILNLNSEVNDATLKETVEAQDYKVISIA
ncbi:MAG: heavy metal translocating P-type ATPase, partial [Firmicutes bacterium]|nr:heavy metal translocating P-type ATPase [Bacillota bacterium]